VHRLEAQGLENEEVERTLNDVGGGLVQRALRERGMLEDSALILIVKM